MFDDVFLRLQTTSLVDAKQFEWYTLRENPTIQK